jgi:hypothetical protein
MSHAGKGLLLALCLVMACAKGTTTSRGDTTVLTQEEIAAAPVSDLMQAVERLRPRWLQARGPLNLSGQSRIVVFANRSYVGGPESLTQFDIKTVLRLRYLDAAQANAQLNVPSGVPVQSAIVVELVAGR